MIAMHTRQGGISLVEIMVALLLSLFLMGGVIQVYLSSKQTYRAQEGYSRLQENGRFALELLSRQIRMAGYKSSAWDQTETAFPPASPFGSAAQIVVGTEGGTTPSPSLSDSVTIRLQGSADGTLQDCLGSTITTSTTIAFTLSSNRLMCATTAQPTPQPIVDGVENMQILYGVDTDGDLYANKYRNANQVGASEWTSVVSIRIGLLLNTVQNVSTEADTVTFNLLGTSVPAPATTDATRFMRRHSFITTISLRNRTP